MDQENDRQWWTQQWMDLINTYRYKKRLERAWKYAREGNVLSFNFVGSKVIALVQGTASEPYQVSLWLNTFADEDWQYVITKMAEKAIFSAKLLAGEMPLNIEEVFAASGLRLFPFSLDELSSNCTCPDKANPCKHISAVYYLLGDRFSEDPFMLFQMRGRTQAQVLTALRQLRVTSELAPEISENSANDLPILSDSLLVSELDLWKFWQYNQPLEPSLVVIVPPPSNETVLDILGNLPVTGETGKSSQVSEKVMVALRQVYQEVSQQAILTALNRGS